jgi:hypothetical protein
MLVSLFVFSTLSAYAEESGDPCGVIKQQNLVCAIVEKGDAYFLLEWAGEGFFYDGHKVCGDITVSENPKFPLTLRDADYDHEMRVRLKKTAPNAETLQEEFEVCGKK